MKRYFAERYGDKGWFTAPEPEEPVREWCGMDPSAMSVEQLRQELGDRGLDRSGDRGLLADRLQKALPYRQEERREANLHIETLVNDHSSSSGAEAIEFVTDDEGNNTACVKCNDRFYTFSFKTICTKCRV